MDIDLIRTFISVERHGSFAAVARLEGVDPSSVSRKIAALELAVDLTLFERTTRRLNLTEAGRIYLERVTSLVDGFHEAADAARDAMVVPAGLLRITASVAFGERWLTPKVASFQKAHPQIDIELILTDAVVDISAEGIDLALRLGRHVEGSFIAAKLFDVNYHTVAAPSYIQRNGIPKTPGDLADHNCILFALPRFGPVWRFRKAADTSVEEIQPNSMLKISNALAIRRAALDGLGIALLADWTVSKDLENGDLVHLLPNYEGSATRFDAAAWIVYPSRNYVPARLRVFIDHLRRTPTQ
ncbi:MAG: LysR family transcriptional regulator [Rhizobiaceae bacterium]|nr:LysR family transcriptional regulator [Rhizobiaceae bacterium]